MDVLTDSWDSVNSLRDPIQEVGQEFHQFCDSNNLTYAVVNLSSSPYLLNTNSLDESLASRLIGNIMGQETENTEVLRKGKDGAYLISQSHDRFQGKDFLELWGRLDNGDFYIVRCPLESIADSAAISQPVLYLYRTGGGAGERCADLADYPENGKASAGAYRSVREDGRSGF